MFGISYMEVTCDLDKSNFDCAEDIKMPDQSEFKRAS